MPGCNSSLVHLDLHKSPEKRTRGWYLSLMAPNEKGPSYAWLDPSRLYCHKLALQDCIEDLLHPFQNDKIDLVAGIDAMGFILGAAIASHLGKGFLAIRKAGHLCVKTYSQSYVDYSAKEKNMEIRTDAIKPGVATICIEDSDGGKWVRENYKCSDCVPDDMRSQFNGHFLESFQYYHSQQDNY
ncbi:adenine phosphoribosyltransferase-like isoform X2 [Rhinoderma darwinii]|uniref:adenine phosphoribosyltransferase-like isoform X2 n=1 Tax=Rhinoderma darwinii TaxID=43563 RepID=UPI003F6714D6